MGLIPPRHVESSQTRDWTQGPCISRWIFNHCTTKGVPIIYLFYSIHSSGCEVITHCGFDCISLMPNDIDIFLCAYWPLVYLFWRNVHSDPVFILNWVVFLLLSCTSLVYITDGYPISDTWFVKLFSFLEGFLFIFSTMSFKA